MSDEKFLRDANMFLRGEIRAARNIKHKLGYADPNVPVSVFVTELNDYIVSRENRLNSILESEKNV